jgi:hypothetical protein
MIKHLFNAALSTWLILLVFELARPGMVQRFINLEYWFFALLILFILIKIFKK